MSDRYEVTVACKSPLHTGAFDKTGNMALIRRHRRVDAEGMPELPCVSGNALRGVIRRTLFRDLFTRCELGPGCEDLKPKQWDRLYAALANGGHLDGSEGATKPTEVRALREALPPLSVLGAALYKSMLSGHVSVGYLWPACSELGLGERTAEELIEDVSLVRHVDREKQDPEVSGVTPMPTTFEAFVTGTELQGELLFAPHATETERSAIGWALAKITTLGGKGGSGHGRVTINCKIESAIYADWLADTAARKATLLDLAKQLTP